MLETTEESVTGALKQARRTLLERRAREEGREPPPAPGSAAERQLVDRLAVAWETDDLKAILASLTDDVWFSMPPVPMEYQGRELAARSLQAVVFRPGHAEFKMLATRVNGQPALAFYFVDPVTGLARAGGLLVLTLAGERVRAVTRFEAGVMDRFGLPSTLPV